MICLALQHGRRPRVRLLVKGILILLAYKWWVVLMVQLYILPICSKEKPLSTLISSVLNRTKWAQHFSAMTLCASIGLLPSKLAICSQNTNNWQRTWYNFSLGFMGWAIHGLAGYINIYIFVFGKLSHTMGFILGSVQRTLGEGWSWYARRRTRTSLFLLSDKGCYLVAFNYFWCDCSAGLVIGPPTYWANPVIGPSKELHQVTAITRELREAIGGFKRQKYDFGDTNVNEFIY